MTVQFGVSSKKPNSTLVPPLTSSYDCQIFDPCTMLEPVIILAGDDPHRFNYVYIPKFSRYYFVRNWEHRGGRWFGYLAVDVLATYRDSIGASVQYVARSSAAANGGIDDRAYTTYASPTVQVETAENPWTGNVYIIGTVGDSGVTYYLISQDTLDGLMSYIFSDTYAEQILEGYEEVYPELKAQLNPLQYVTYLKYFPVDFPSSGGNSIPVGWVTTPYSGLVAAIGSYFTERLSLSVPKHPGAGAGSYLNMSPYSEYSLYFPPFGIIQLDSLMLSTIDTIGCEVKVDPHSGDASLRVHTPDDATIAYVHGRLGVDVQLAHVTAPGWGTGNTAKAVAQGVSNVAGIVASASMGNVAGVIGGMSGLINTVSDTIGAIGESKVPSISSVGGGSGGAAAWHGDVQLIATFLPVVAKDTQGKGNPLCQVSTVSSLPGYLEVKWPRLDIAATTDEISTIYRFMEGGFYFE